MLYTPSGAWAQPVYKCRQPDGRIAYQAEKCAHGATQSELAPPPRPASAAPAAEAPVSAEDLQKVVGILASFERCAAHVPGFAAKHDAALKEWKQRNLAAMVQYSQDGESQRKVRESAEYSKQQARQASAEERRYQAESCDELAASWLKNPKTPDKTP